jgi:hypothetical protein
MLLLTTPNDWLLLSGLLLALATFLPQLVRGT